MFKKIYFLFIFLFIISFNSYSQDIQKDLLDLKNLLETGVINKEEYNSARKIIEEKGYKEKVTKSKKHNKKITKEVDQSSSKKIANTNFQTEISNFRYDQSRKFDVIYNLELLGRYDFNFENSRNFPLGMVEFWGGDDKCLEFICRQQKSSKEMSKRFKRTKKYNNRYPGSIFYAMAHFEYYYQYKLYKGEDSISKTFAKFKGDQPFNPGFKKIKSLIGLNKIRKKLRNALGMNLNTDPIIAINRFWAMGNFMNRAQVKQNEVSTEIDKRKKLVEKYRSLSDELREKTEKNLEKEMFSKIKEGRL